MIPSFTATQRFDPSDAERWNQYVEWAKIPKLVEVVSLDCGLCPNILKRLEDEDFRYLSPEHCFAHFRDLDYLLGRVAAVSRRNILGLYRNPDRHIEIAPATRAFVFMGYDLIEEATSISALTNCGGFADVFANGELNGYGLIPGFARASEVWRLLRERHPEENHADCEMYAIWRLEEASNTN